MIKPTFFDQGLQYFYLVCKGLLIAAFIAFIGFLFDLDIAHQAFFPDLRYHPNFILGPNNSLLLLGSVIVALLLIEIVHRIKPQRFPAEFGVRFKLAFLAVFVFSLCIQTIGQWPYIVSQFKRLTGRAEEQRVSDKNILNINRFIRFCQEHIKGRHAAQLITDINIEQQPGDYYYRYIAVSLYPIDVRGIRGEPQDVLVIFDKSDPYNSVPNDYQVLAVYDQRSLLAVRRGDDARLY